MRIPRVDGHHRCAAGKRQSASTATMMLLVAVLGNHQNCEGRTGVNGVVGAGHRGATNLFAGHRRRLRHPRSGSGKPRQDRTWLAWLRGENLVAGKRSRQRRVSCLSERSTCTLNPEWEGDCFMTPPRPRSSTEYFVTGRQSNCPYIELVSIFLVHQGMLLSCRRVVSVGSQRQSRQPPGHSHCGSG